VKQHKHILLILVILLAYAVSMNDWDNPYKRPIIGDAKGYYAYLPAAFIYQDFSFAFIDDVEQKYYPHDGTLAKDFLVEQPNGTKVNKCFPGVSIFYLPFFLLAYFLSFLFGLPLDGYAPLFQWSIAVAHWFYFILALVLLDKIFLRNGVSWINRFVGFAAITFASNLLFHLVHDFSVAHVFGFFVFAYFIKIAISWNESPTWTKLSWMAVLICLSVIMRPTNALFVLVLPLLVEWSKILYFTKQKIIIKDLPWLQVIISITTLSIPLVLWKIQTGSWLVYSYGDERLNFTSPHLFKFLFSVQKGWWFWSPVMLLFTFFSSIYFWKIKKWQGIYFGFLILFVAYIFSCWWMWTFGGGLGQRPMVDFYPILLIGLVGFLHRFPKSRWFSLVLIPLILLNTVQAYQIDKYILVGGQTTWSDYKSHFLQIKRDAPKVEVDASWSEVNRIRIEEPSELNENAAFSSSLLIDSLPQNAKLLLRTKVGGAHESSNLALIVSNGNASFYHAQFVGNYLYRKPREMAFLLEVPTDISAPLKVYFWNHDSGERAVVEWIEVVVYE
jgi:hypothetical protein